MNDFLQDLCNWLSVDRLRKKVLFVRNIAVGNQLLRMAAKNATGMKRKGGKPVPADVIVWKSFD